MNLLMRQMSRRHLFATLSLIALVSLMAVANRCEKKQLDPENSALAQVGDEAITVHDFRTSYEFGFPHLKTGENRKRAYLDRMIDEKLLSLQGYSQGLEKSERVKKLLKQLEEELVVEQVFLDHVTSKIEVSDQEIKEAVNKSKVSFKLRFWYEPSREFAENVCAYMREYGYAETVKKILSGNPEVRLDPREFETSYLTWLDLSPELLATIQDLELGAISNPVEMGEGYYIFQMLDVRREPVTEYDYQDRSETFRKILRARKQEERTAQFIAALMTPKKVITRGKSFSLLSKNLYEWYKNKEKNEELGQALAEPGSDRPYLQSIRQNRDLELVTFEGGRWTISDFLEKFDPKRINLKEKEDLTGFQSRFNDQIAATVQDYFLLQMGYKAQVQKRPEVKAEIKQWKDKWVYQAYRRQLAVDFKVSENDAAGYLEKNPDRFKARVGDQPAGNIDLAKQYLTWKKEQTLVNSEVAKLRGQYRISIDSALLDTMKMIESDKSRGMSLQVFKRNSNRMAYPVVDPGWGL